MPRDPINRLGVILGVFVVLSLAFQGLLACNSHWVRRTRPAPPALELPAAELPVLETSGPVRDAPCDPALPCAVGPDTLFLRGKRP